MEDISSIIREARPLYYARKKQRRAVTFIGLFLLCLVAVNIKVRNFENVPVYDFWTDDVYLSENVSPIEEMGLPVDEYGLLMVG